MPVYDGKNLMKKYILFQAVYHCLEYHVLIGNIFPVIEGVSLKRTGHPQLVIVHINLESMH